jgi:hypothetical protein
LTNEELENISADEFVRLKLTEDEKSRLWEINQRKERERAERLIRIQAEQMPIVRDLAEVGIEVRSLSDLIMRSAPYSAAIPVLLRHLVLPYSDVTRETIARSLAVPEPDVRKAWPTLVEEYRKASTGMGRRAPGDPTLRSLHAKDGLAAALSVAATDVTIDELVALAKDPSLGESRLLLLRGIRRSRNPAAKRAIEELASDPALAKEIASWKRAR